MKMVFGSKSAPVRVSRPTAITPFFGFIEARVSEKGEPTFGLHSYGVTGSDGIARHMDPELASEIYELVTNHLKDKGLTPCDMGCDSMLPHINTNRAQILRSLGAFATQNAVFITRLMDTFKDALPIKGLQSLTTGNRRDQGGSTNDDAPPASGGPNEPPL